MNVYARALSYFRPDWKRIVVFVLLMTMIVGLGTALAWPMAILFDVVLSPTGKTGVVYDFFRNIAPATPALRIAAVAALYIVCKSLLDLLSCLRTMLSNNIKYRGTVRVRRELYRHFHRLGSAYHNTQPQGDAIFRLSNDTYGPFGIFDTIFTTGQHAATLLSVAAVMLTRNVPLTLFALALTPLMLVANWFFGGRIKRRADTSRQIDADLMTVVQRAMSGIGLIEAYNRHKHEQRRYEGSLQKSVRASMSLDWQENLYPLAIQCIYGLGQAALIGYGGYMVYRDQLLNHAANGMSYGDLVLLMSYFSQLLNPLSEVAGFTARVKTSVVACLRVFTILDKKPSIVEAPNAVELPVKPRTLKLSDLTFGYKNGEHIIRKVSARIRPGEMVAFVGASGAGKSTLLKLISRFYDPVAGGILLDDKDLRQLTLASVRQHITIVSQENALLAGTISENIRYGNLFASDRQVRRAAELAGAAEFIDALPAKYETEIVEAGKNLSGGQRQRLAIARALLTAAPILIFDEPTSALDSQTEQHIIRTLMSLKGKRTIIIVTHKLTSIGSCDNIFILQGGNIVEQGTYAQLLARKGFEIVPQTAKPVHVA